MSVSTFLEYAGRGLEWKSKAGHETFQSMETKSERSSPITLTLSKKLDVLEGE
jgi:hypothetical protein